jgi:hypothetical protein
MAQKELGKLSQWFWKGFLEWYDRGGENRITSKRIFEVEVFFSSQNIDFPFIWRDSWSVSFTFFSCSVSWGLGGFDDIWGENHFFKNFFSNGFNILAVDTYSGMKLCTPTWLNHDYGHGGVVDILAMDAYSDVEVCMPIFWVRLAKKIWVANNFRKIFKTQMDTSLNKAQHK